MTLNSVHFGHAVTPSQLRFGNLDAEDKQQLDLARKKPEELVDMLDGAMDAAMPSQRHDGDKWVRKEIVEPDKIILHTESNTNIMVHVKKELLGRMVRLKELLIAQLDAMKSADAVARVERAFEQSRHNVRKDYPDLYQALLRAVVRTGDNPAVN